MKFCSLLLLLLFNIVQASYVTHPNINFDPLQQIGISGSYNGISLYKDTNQLTTLKQQTSSVISLSNDTLQLLASSNINGIIYDACIFNNQLVFAGNFTSLNNNKINNIASIDLTSKQLIPLSNGLDGPVNTIYCDTNQIYVGGSFIAPTSFDIPTYSNSLSQFGGSVATWKSNQWVGLPWKGLNGPVYSIVKDKNNRIIFGGKFDTTTDGQTFYAPASQPISLPATGVSATSGNNPASILCTTSSWLLDEGKQGTWQASFITYNVNPSLVRISNSKVENHQTKEFSIRSLTNATLNFSLAYLDPVTGIAKTCKDNCTLSNDPSVTYQDFRILDTFMTSGIAIDIKSWYGVGGGLSFVQVFQSEIFTYAVQQDQTNACTSNKNALNVTTTGTWTSVSTSSSPYLTSRITSATTNASITLYPDIAEPGIYELLVYTPQCEATNCAERTDINVLISHSPNNNASSITMSQKYPGSRSIYTGYFDYSSKFNPSIKLSIAKNATVSTTSYLVAYAVQLIKTSSDYTLSSLLQYDPAQTNITTSNLSWKALPDTVPYNSIVRTMKLSGNGDLYIGGSFSGLDKNNTRYNNIVRYDASNNLLKPLTGYGLNGPVYSIDFASADVYVGGNFTSLSNTTTTNTKDLSYVARYNVNSQIWNPLNAGVNGPVKSVHALSTTVLISGDFTYLTNSQKASGNAWWDTLTWKWITDSKMPYISGTVYATSTQNNDIYFIGNITNIQRYQTNGISFLNGTNSFTFPAFYPDSTQPSIVSAGVLFDQNSGNSKHIQDPTTTTIFAGTFTLSNLIKNIAIYENNTWSGLQGTDWSGQINSIAVNNQLLYVGGQFTSASTNHFAIFDLSTKSSTLLPKVQTLDTSKPAINIVKHIPSQNSMVVGGHFDSIDSLSCSSICALNTETMQWNNLGSGLIGEVYDIILIDDKLVTSGNLSLNDSPIHIAQFDFKKNTWGPFDTANLPGPSRALSYDNVTNHLYISGESDKSNYLRIWDGHQFNEPKEALGPGSFISKMSILPVTDESQNILLATGFLNLNELGNVSAAFYNGQTWIPYLVTSEPTSTTSIFFLDQPYIPTIIRNYLATPLVILAAIAISLCIVFLIVLSAMFILYIRRKRDAKINPQSNPSTYYGKPPRTPESLLTMLKDTSAPEKTSDDEDDEKLRHLEPGTQQFYNMSKSISTDHIADQGMTTARPTPTTHARSISNQMAARPESFVRPMSEYQRDTELYYNNPNYSREMAEVPGRVNSYNPFRNSEIGVAVGTAAAVGAVAATNQGPNYLKQGEAASYNGAPTNNSYSTALSAAPIKTSYNTASSAPMNNLYNTAPANAPYNNALPAAPINTGYNAVLSNAPVSNTFTGASSAAAMGGVSTGGTRAMGTNAMTSNTTNPTFNSAFSTGASSTGNTINGAIGGAVLGGAAMAGAGALTNNNSRNITQNNTNYNYPTQQIGEAVSYNNIPVATPSTAVVSDVTGTRDMKTNNSPYQNTAYSSIPPPAPAHHTVSSPNPVKWTTAAPVEASTFAIVDPMADHNFSVPRSSAENVRWTNAPNSQTALATAIVSPVAPTIAVHKTDDPMPASNVQWTNQTANNALGVAKIDSDTRESTYHNHGSLYSPLGSNHSLLSTALDTNNDDFSSDPDIARFTSKPKLDSPVDANRSTSSLGRPQYQAALTVPQWPAEDQHTDLPSFEDDINTKVIHKNAFRLSDAGSLPPIDTSMFSKNVPIGGSDSPEELLSPDSAVRWKTANVGSPIETAYVPKMHAPASATVTRRSTIENDQALDDYYNPKPTTSPLSEKPVEEPIGRKSETIDEAIAKRDLNALSLIIQEEENPLQRKAPVGVGAMDGRASSKRMVEEYFSSRKSKVFEDKKSKYKSDFRSIMAIAIQNNTKYPIATEDNPHLYYAKFDFSAREHGELGFEKANPIIVVDSSDDIWWMGYKADKSDGSYIQGVFPSNYVEIATELR